MQVPFFEYPRHYTDHKDDILRIIDEVASKGNFIMQQELFEFEENLATFTGANHAIGVANATDALEIAIQSLGLRKGDEVICSAHTMLATASAIKLSGAKPVPVDIGFDNLICPDAIESAVTSRTVGIMPTHLNGRTCNMDHICSIAEKYKLFIVEDAAQALGSRFNGKSAGTFGYASAISFFPAKVLGCLGDGGALLTNDSTTYDVLYQLHDHGRNKDGEQISWGRNSRLDNINAAILDYKLKSYSEVISRRREIADMYHQQLSSLPQLRLPPKPSIETQHFDVFQNYELQAEDRDGLRLFLKRMGIGTLIQWGGKAIHQWQRLGMQYRLPKTEEFFRSCLMLPMNVFLTDTDISYVSNSIKEFYSKRA